MSKEEDSQLLQLKQKAAIPQRVRDRAEIVRLNSHGWSVTKIAEYMKKSPHTVRSSLHRWQLHGVEGLWEAQGRGRKPGWNWEDIEYLENCLKSENRTYNSQQLSQKLATERGIQLSADRIRRLLKKRGGDGKEHATSNPNLPTPSLNRQNVMI